MVQIIVCAVVICFVLAIFTHFRREANEFKSECRRDGGHVKVVGASRSKVYLCLDSQGRLLRSKNI